MVFVGVKCQLAYFIGERDRSRMPNEFGPAMAGGNRQVNNVYPEPKVITFIEILIGMLKSNTPSWLWRGKYSPVTLNDSGSSIRRALTDGIFAGGLSSVPGAEQNGVKTGFRRIYPDPGWCRAGTGRIFALNDDCRSNVCFKDYSPYQP